MEIAAISATDMNKSRPPRSDRREQALKTPLGHPIDGSARADAHLRDPHHPEGHELPRIIIESLFDGERQPYKPQDDDAPADKVCIEGECLVPSPWWNPLAHLIQGIRRMPAAYAANCDGEPPADDDGLRRYWGFRV